MDRAWTFRKRVVVALLLTAAVTAVAASAPLAEARPDGAIRCAQLSTLKSVFPTAKSIGFLVRRQIRPQGARAPIWPGRCGAFWTTYEGTGASIDVSVTLYATSHDVLAALAEPLYGSVQVLPNGARVRTIGPVHTSVNGTRGSDTGVVSAFRNLFISSTSISTGPHSLTTRRKTPCLRGFSDGPAWIRTRDQRIMSPLL